MNKLTKAIVLSIVCISAKAQLHTVLTSPNGKLRVEINGDKELSYNVVDDGVLLMQNNQAALNFTGTTMSRFVSATKAKTVREHIKAPNYKFESYDDVYNQVILKNANGNKIEFRAYDSGVAYRWIGGSKHDWTIDDEVASFSFVDDYTAYLPYSTNENKPMAMAFQATYDVAPLSESKNLEAFLPATVDCRTAKVTLLETDVQSYPGMFVIANTKNDDKSNNKTTSKTIEAKFAHYPLSFEYYPWRVQKYVSAEETFIAKGTGVRTFPWRIMAITHNDAEMPVNTLAYSLSENSRIETNTEWIRPGKVAWDWWNDWGISDVDFKAGINQQTYKYYIDFAAQNGIEYIILDEGWYNPKSGDMLTVIPELNLPELVDYAKCKGVGIILWTVFNVLDSQLDEACQTYAAMGIKGFKVDFLDRYDQEAVEMIYRIADRCAQSHLLLDYHGIFAPQGIQRTYPNVLNFEAVFGMEEVKWTERFKGVRDGKRVDEPSKDMPLYDVTFPFIRGMAGSVDFTPGGFRNSTKADFQPIYNNPLTMGTRCHQLAHYIVHESPLTMLADNPTIYLKEQECTRFICSLPTTYQHMKCLQGEIGKYIVMARKQGSDWYVAGETNWDARDIKLCLDFLPAGQYEMTIFTDGINSEKDATDYQVIRKTINIATNSDVESLSLHMASGGGFAAKIIKK